MSLRDDALNYLRAVFGRERIEREKAESPSAEAEKHLPSSIFSVWGREDIGGLLTVSQNLMDRYADYEQMDEYPDINCVAGDTLVYVLDGSIIKPTTVQQLTIEGGAARILAVDFETRKAVAVDADNPRLTGLEAEVIAVKLGNGETIRCTPNHKFLHATKGYVDASTLVAGDQLVSMRPGFDPRTMGVFLHWNTGTVAVVEAPTPAGRERVFDITTSTHNFVANGVVVHNSANHYFTNDATQPDIDTGRTIWVHAQDQAMKEIADTLLTKRLKIEDEIWSMAYSLVKMGNDFEEVLVTENGVIGLNFLPVPTMRRIEASNGSVIGYVQDVTGKFTQDAADLRGMLAGQSKVPDHVAVFEDWQVLHMRLRGTARRCPYGFCVGDGARWIWKRLVLLEDAMLIYKLTRAPARYAFYVDVTDIPSDRVESFLRKTKQDLKKTKLVNPRTQRLDMRYNPMSSDEDFILAVRDGKELARVEVLQGPDYQATDDVEYFARKLHGTLKVPRSYLGQDDAIPGRAILSNEDVRASRVTMSIQRELRNGILRLVQIDLAARGINPFEQEVQVLMTVPSGIYELAANEIKNARADFASRIQPFVSMRYIRERVLKMNDDEIAEMEKQIEREQAQQAAMGGGPGGSGGPGGPVKLPDTSGAMEPQDPGAPDMTPAGFKPSNPSEWKRYDQLRRLEEGRERLTRQNLQQIDDKLGQLLENDRHFAARLAHTRAFLDEFRKTVFARGKNGGLQSAPPGRRRARANGNGNGH